MPPARSIKVFVSSAMAELEYDREIVAEALRDVNVSPVLFEVFPALSLSPSESCLDEVRSSDIFVMLLWKSLRPAVREEYAEALNRGKPVLILVKSLNESEEREADLNAFLAGLAGGSDAQLVRRVTWKHYRRVAELKAAVRESIATEIAKFYREPIYTLARSEMYELGTSIVRYAQKRLYLFQRTPSLILGARDYLADGAMKYAYEKEFADAVARWVTDNYTAVDKEFLCLFSAEATKEEIRRTGQHANLLRAVKENIERVKTVEERSSFRFRICVIDVPMSGPLIVGDNRYAMWLLGGDDAVCVSQENEKICDILVRMLKIHGQRRTDVPELLSALGLACDGGVPLLATSETDRPC